MPVAFAGGLKFEGPLCSNGSAVEWRAHYAPDRYIRTYVHTV